MKDKHSINCLKTRKCEQFKTLTGLTSPFPLVNCRAKPKSNIKQVCSESGVLPMAKLD